MRTPKGPDALIGFPLIMLFFLCFFNAYGGDGPCSATSLSNNMLDFETYDFSGLSDSGIDSPECSNYAGPDIWFQVICPPSGRLTIVTVPGFTDDAAMAVYSGTCFALEEILCVEDDICNNSIMPIQDMFDLNPGETYFIRIWPQNGSPSGTFEIRVSDGPPDPILFELVNDATYIDVDGEECIRLTSEGTGQSGCAWEPDQYDFSQPIDVSISFNFGDMDAGADGICIVFQDSPAGLSACGSTGENIGAGGIQNSLIIEFDTYFNSTQGDLTQDHVAVNINGNMGNQISGPVSLGNIEDGQYHTMQFTWNPSTLFYEVFFDDVSQLSGNYDVVNNCFGGNNLAYYGFTASTGGAVNNHIVCPHITYPSGNEREEMAEICEGESYFAGGANQTQSGYYTDIFTAYNGCDSIVHTDLLVHERPEIDLDTIICENNCFEIGGQVFCQEGSFDVVITGGSVNGCDSIVHLDLTIFDPVAIVLPPETLNCENTVVILDANFSTEGDDISYSWTGPDGYSSSEQNPAVTAPGEYTLVVIQSDGDVVCLSNANTVTVEQNIELPIADGGPDMTIDCQNSSIILDGSNSSSGQDISIQWTGPNGFTSTELNPEVDQAGIYSLIVSHNISLCFEIDIVLVDIQVDTPDIETFGAVLNCNIDSVQINANSSMDLNYHWTGPGGFESDNQNPFVFLSGDYIVEAIDNNGCTAIDTAIVTNDDLLPDVTLSADTLSCLDIFAQIFAETEDQDLIFQWTGPNGFTSSDQNPIVDQIGDYELLSVAANGCSNISVITIEGEYNLPDIEALGDTIGCNESEIQIFASSNTQNVDFSWSGPGGFTSLDQNPLVTANGIYIVELTASNGCIALDTAYVSSDSLSPQISLTADTINCLTFEPYISVSSSIQDVNYSWSGPSGFMGNSQLESVMEAGIYSVTVTSQNGCTSLGEIEVILDQDQPEVNLVADTINCINPFITIEANPLSSDYVYEWTGPGGFESDEINPEISTPGQYSLNVQGANGCFKNEIIEVIADTQLPEFALEADEINCFANQFYLNVLTQDLNLSYNWEGPSTFSSILPNPEILEGGIYNLTVTGENGCSDIKSIQVIEDVQEPIIILDDKIINCTSPEIEVIPGGDITELSFEWTGPGGFVDTNEEVILSEPGTYYLVSKAQNGCTSLDSFIVVGDFDPAIIDLVLNEDIDCINNGVTIFDQIIGDVTQVTWEGPNGFEFTGNNPFVTEQGDYYISVLTNNGCISSDSIYVISIADIPEVSLTGEIINCLDSIAGIVIQSDVQDPEYYWVGPDGFESNEGNLFVTQPGIYELELINPINNCKSFQVIEILEDRNAPMFSVEAENITCNNQEALITAVANNPAYNYSWSGPGGFSTDQQTFRHNMSGIYLVNVTDSSNGCASQQEIEIESIEPPALIEFDLSQPGCNESFGSLSMLQPSGGTGPFEYSLNGSPYSNNPDFSQLAPGSYILSVKDFYDCIIEDNFEIEESTEPEILIDEEFTISIGENFQLFPEINLLPDELESISWSPDLYLDCNDCLYPITSPPQSIQYELTIVDKNGCSAVSDVLIRVEAANLFVPNVFSPNGDGINDFFTIFGNKEQVIEVESLDIFDRWGNKVFSSLHFPINDEALGWNGKFIDGTLNPGVFAYLASILLINGETRMLSGSVTLIE